MLRAMPRWRRTSVSLTHRLPCSCLCTGLSIRSQDLGKPLSDSDYPLINRLYSAGIGALVAYAKDEFDFTPGKSAYGSKCKLCFEIRRFLVNQKKKENHELQPLDHYADR